MSNLRLINETSSQSSFVNQVSITDVFTSDFEIYKIIINNCDYENSDTNVIDLRLRLINSTGNTITAAHYDSARLTMKAESSYDNDKFTDLGYMYGSALFGNYDNSGATIYIFSPTDASCYTFMSGSGAGGYDTSNNRFRGTKAIGVLKQTTSITGINFVSSLTSGDFKCDIRIYGLRADS